MSEIAIEFLKIGQQAYENKINENSIINIKVHVPPEKIAPENLIMIVGPEGVGKSYLVKRLVIEEHKQKAITFSGSSSGTKEFSLLQGLGNKIIIDTIGLGSRDKMISTQKIIDQLRKSSDNPFLSINKLILIMNPGRDHLGSKLPIYERIIDDLNLSEKLDNVYVLLNVKEKVDDSDQKTINAEEYWRGILKTNTDLSKTEMFSYLVNLKNISPKHVYLVSDGEIPKEFYDVIEKGKETIRMSDSKCIIS